ncbi:MAG: cbb3-type cytochrome c oxidase N-terminal domain-containing protein [Flavobacteriales bacterium]|nr:MAG: cbb3-type cytochrome c oxidase N-terminal domain-containing protein [Flavobacteriales bacterium]
MRTDRIPTGRLLALAALSLTTLSAIAQDAAPAAASEPLIRASGTVNYVMLGLAVVQVVLILAMSGILRSMMGSAGWMRKLTERRGPAVLLPLFLLLSGSAQAQAYTAPVTTMSHQELFYLLLVVNLFLFIVLMVQINLLRGTMRAITGVFEEARGEAAPVPQGPTVMQRVMNALTRRPSAEKEQDLLLHHDYDGIRELDNVLPPWWVWLFYGTIAWSVLYLVNMHVVKSWPLQHEEYTEAMDQAKADIAAYMATTAAAVDENTVTVTADATALAGAKASFTQYCAACHGADAAGSETSVGPNLTDAYWIHGGGVKEIFRTIKYGVPEKGMISWKSQLKPTEIQALASYILSLKGTGPATQKAPQGDLWKEEGAAPADSTAAAPADTVRVAGL